MEKHPFCGSTNTESAPAELFESAICIMNCVCVPSVVISELENSVTMICGSSTGDKLREGLIKSLQSFGSSNK